MANAKGPTVKYKNVQFWVSDLLKAYDVETEAKNTDWITSVGE